MDIHGASERGEPLPQDPASSDRECKDATNNPPPQHASAAQDIPPSHTLSEPYSAAHPVPTVQKFLAEAERHQRGELPPAPDTSATAELQVRPQTPEEEREEKKEAETHAADEAAGGDTGGEKGEGETRRRRVMDPVTGNRDVVIEDFGREALKDIKSQGQVLTAPVENVLGTKTGPEVNDPPL
ncbi:hypothetical protein BDZ91DRAFT_747144 [Kalaharituber pfeilii]|nr:hypothetical protein BDZ91DRAFT_747144 [Kalaharituber pfeilii]